jgi:hypothetical protein
MDHGQKIVFQRMSIEQQIEMAKKAEQQAKNVRKAIEGNLSDLQRDCPHENTTEKPSWQGGGLYYIPTECHHCGKKWDRYDKQLNIDKAKESDRLWGKLKDDAYYDEIIPNEPLRMLFK